MKHEHLSSAIKFYRERGYSYVHDAPYVVGKAAYYATKPPGAKDIRCLVDGEEEQYLVASGEQSFLQMLFDGKLLKRAVCLTPCFRAEKHTDWNKFAFQKVELINADDPTGAYLTHMVHDAMAFFEQFVPIRLVETGRSDGHPTYDIVEKNSRVELGSFGIRSAPHPDGKSRDLQWIYGTGCAEPRLSDAIERERLREIGDARRRQMERDRL